MHIVSLHPRVVSLASRLVEPNHDGIKGGKDDDDAIFAELEAEIENDDNAAFREKGLEQLKQESI